MDRDELRATQAPLKQRYRDAPASARITLHADGELGEEAIACSVDTGRQLVAAGLHEMSGGDGMLACSGELLLQALAACAGVTLRSVATSMGIEARGRIHVEGDLDFRGTLGVDKETPVGFTHIRVRFDLESSATKTELATLERLTERYCVVLQTLLSAPRVAVTTARTATT